MDFGFDGSFAKKRGISLRGNSKKEDRATLMRKAREERQARQLARAQKDSALLIQRVYRMYKSVKQAKCEEYLFWKSRIEMVLQNHQVPSFDQDFDLINRFKYTLSVNSTAIENWCLLATFLLDPRAISYQNPPLSHQTAVKAQQQYLFTNLLHVLDNVTSPIPEQITTLMELLFNKISFDQGVLNQIAMDESLVRVLKRWLNVDARICDFLFQVISRCLDIEDDGKTELSTRFVLELITDIGHISNLSAKHTDYLLEITTKLTKVKVPPESVLAVANLLFEKGAERHELLPFILSSFDAEKINSLLKVEKDPLDIDSDEEWLSDEEMEEADANGTQRFISSLSKFASLRFLKTSVASAFPEGVTDINSHFISLCQLGILLREVKTRDNTLFNMLNHLAFYFRVAPKMWRIMVGSGYVSSFQCDNIKESDDNVLSFFCMVCGRWLLAMDDHEFFDSQEFLQMKEWKEMVLFLKAVVVAQYEAMQSQHQNYSPSFTTSVSNLLQLLYERDCRKPFADEGWVSASITHLFHTNYDTRVLIITNVPFFIPLDDRFKLFHDEVSKRKKGLDNGYFGRNVVTIHRNDLFEEGFDNLSRMPLESFIRPFKVEFINSSGLSEAGIDGGGLFKEFITEMLHQGFNPDRGLFTYSHSRELYPNPTALEAVENWSEMYRFMGRLLGKSLFELVLVHLPLSRFFISRLLKKSVNHVNDLSILDPALYEGLMKLKNYEGNVEEDFSLTFSLLENNLGKQYVVDLIPGGRHKPVTNQNRMKYIFLRARYRLNVKIKQQVDLFLSGFYEVIPFQWIQMFNENELQQLISGVQGPLDIADLRRNTVYNGGYHDNDPSIQMFWSVLESLTPEQQRKFLKFVTSSERSPLLGFSYLEPKFSITKEVGQTRLPSAGSCFSLLRLPPYSTFDLMRDKLVYAIESNSGFELS